MEWFIENWYIVIALLCCGAVMGVAVYKFIELPTTQKMELFKKALLELVTKAEEEIGSGNGQEKLEYVYNAIKKQFPFITLFMSKDTFNTLVNGALIEVGIWLKKKKK